ncbi:MAG: Flp pilus assembly complex ATPase component TadA [candidate division Zixibacteria bacterium]|nr:Flp pilus assembly complex ATPase component TadA [candidate division Zixibacteria bacterium]
MTKSIGELLLESKTVTPKQFDVALREQKRTGEKIGLICERLGFVNPDVILKLLSQQSGSTYFDFSSNPVELEALQLVPEAMARELKLIPTETQNNKKLIVAMANPNDIMAIDKLRKITSLDVEPKTAAEEDILAAIDTFYGMEAATEKIIEESLAQTLSVEEVEKETPPLIKLVDAVIAHGIREGATDIHFETDDKVGRIRYRVDGILEPGFILPKKIYSPAVSRLKIMGGMDITEQRIPQDGGIRFNYNSKDIDIRVSSLPIMHGESVVLRILAKPRFLLSLDQLGFTGENLVKFRRMVQKSYGMIVLTGPTGSGKSTTLYAALKTLNALEKNIITLEDPIESQIPLTKQSQVLEKAGYTFAKGLRACMRHDPDVILIGEMRDTETAQMAFRASMTGHLVFTTLHANTASASVARLLDLGIESFIVATSLLAVISQRLLRKVCSKCKTTYTPKEEELAPYHLEKLLNTTLYKGEGCEKCKFTGYKGRMGIFEVLEVTPEINELIARRATSYEIEKTAKFEFLFEDGIKKVLAGATTLSEVLRVAG